MLTDDTKHLKELRRPNNLQLHNGNAITRSLLESTEHS